MGYDPVISTDAAADLEGLSPEFRELVTARIGFLCEDPFGRLDKRRRSRSWKGPSHTFYRPIDGVRFRVQILYHFVQGRQEIGIVRILVVAELER